VKICQILDLSNFQFVGPLFIPNSRSVKQAARFNIIAKQAVVFEKKLITVFTKLADANPISGQNADLNPNGNADRFGFELGSSLGLGWACFPPHPYQPTSPSLF